MEVQTLHQMLIRFARSAESYALCYMSAASSAESHGNSLSPPKVEWSSKLDVAKSEPAARRVEQHRVDLRERRRIAPGRFEHTGGAEESFTQAQGCMRKLFLVPSVLNMHTTL